MQDIDISTKSKIKIMVVALLIFLLGAAGITYAFFGLPIEGNERASENRMILASLHLKYNDIEILSDSRIFPGWSDTKTLTVENDGNVDVDYIIKWKNIQNSIPNGDLRISATCVSSVQGNTCDGIPSTIIPYSTTQLNNIFVSTSIPIEPNEVHTYTVTVELLETGSNQNYVKGKSFHGTLNIGDGTPTDESCFTTSGTTTLSITNYDETCGTNVIIPSTINGKTVTSIASATYDSSTSSYKNSFVNKGLTSVVIPNSITSIGTYAFRDNQLTSVVIPNSVTTISAGAFSSNQLVLAAIPSSVTTISNAAFRDNQLTSVVIPNGVTSLGAYAFQDNQLSSVAISSSVTSIGASAFYNNQLTSIIIPSSVTSIGYNAFYGSSSSNRLLTSVTIKGKTSSSDFTTYGTNIWGWADASNRTCTVTDNTSNVEGGCITWVPPTFQRLATDATTGLPVVKRTGTNEEFYDITNAINYSSLDSTFLTKINYDSSKSILLAKYNLYVGQTCTSSSSCIPISTTATGYGLQSADAKGYLGNWNNPAVAVVPFSGSSTSNGYWYDTANSTIYSKYGTSGVASNIYDTNYNAAPNYSVAFENNAGNANYSIAYYVEEYINTLGIEGVGRLLTYTEANAMTTAQRTNGARYWLGSARNNIFVRGVDSAGNLSDSYFISIYVDGVRPVIVVYTSDIATN